MKQTIIMIGNESTVQEAILAMYTLPKPTYYNHTYSNKT